MKPRITTAQLMKAIAALALLFAALAFVRRAYHHVETLDSPIAVRGWSAEGLQLADGRTLRVPGFESLPVTSPALSEATRSGVEIGNNGRVRGLVRVWHACGNDPVRNHVVRVDLSELLAFVSEGIPDGELNFPSVPPFGGWTRYSSSGWEVSEFHGFDSWHRECRRFAEENN